ncbi:MAG: hypothetical protein J1G30_07255, partial [Spirochaetales bacterium]|nr:hypothetical protein [Spirochaetales bacterium]
SLYNWTITIDSTKTPFASETYTNELASLNAAEKHYLELKVIVTDRAGNKTNESNSNKGFLCLYQEADRPWVEVSSLISTGTFEDQLDNNKLSAGTQITGSAYDDDSLDNIEFRIVNADDNEPVGEVRRFEKNSFGETGFTVWDLMAPVNQGRYRLYYRLKDSNGTTSYGTGADWSENSGWDKTYSIGFQVIDESAPVTEMTPFDSYPKTAYVTEENPAFIIEGTTRDSAGISQIMLAWDPNASEEKAVSLRKAKWNITENGYYDGVKYWIVDLKKFENVQENNTFKMVWSYEIPVSDFVSDGDESTRKPIYGYKKMYYCVVSSSENYAVGTFTIPQEYTPPELTIDFPKNNETYRNVGSERFAVSGTCSDEQSGIASLIIKYKKALGGDAEYDVLGNEKIDPNGTWSVTSDLLEGLGGSYQQISVEARDNFGNINLSSVMIIVDDDSPRVSSIKVIPEGGYYSVGKKLNFTVTMNKEVVVNGNSNGLRLELNCGEDVNKNPFYAVFTGISDDNKVLNFEYEVKAGDAAEPLDYVSENSLKLSNGTKVMGKAADGKTSTVEASLTLPVPGESGSLAVYGVFIDTERPRAMQITTNVGEGIYKAGDKIEISVQFNENVSGRAKIDLNNGKSVEMKENVTNTDTLIFSYIVQAGDDVAVLDIAQFFAFDESTTITDAAGNEMNFTDFPKGSDLSQGSDPNQQRRISLADAKIKIDTVVPTLDGVFVSSDGVSVSPYEGTYYLNAGKTITFEAHFSEAVTFTSQPHLVLSALNNSNKVQAQYKSGLGSSILLFTYTVNNGDNSDGNLRCTALSGAVTDLAGNAVLGSINNEKTISDTLQNVNGSEISIIIDTKSPAAPTFGFAYVDGSTIGSAQNNALYNRNVRITPKMADGETTAAVKLFASVAGGQTRQDWENVSSYDTDTNNAEESWTVKAQVVDYAGNTSPISTVSFTVDNGVPLLNAINTTVVSGLYKEGTAIPITLVFSKSVKLNNNVTVTFDNGGTAVISGSNNSYSASYKGTYTVGSNKTNESDTDKLKVDSISGGSFTDKAGNAVAGDTAGKGHGLATSGSFEDNFSDRNIQIDTTAPTVESYAVESISDETYTDSSSYYLNAGKTVRIAVTFSEEVMISGDSVITLSHGKQATYSGASADKKTLYYTYTVASGDTADKLGINESGAYPTNIQDAAGNVLTGKLPSNSNSAYKGKSIVIDTTAPDAPTVKIYKYKKGTDTKEEEEITSFAEAINEEVLLKISSEETDTAIKYSVNNGAEYEDYNKDGVTIGERGSSKTYYIIAKQTDKAGNTSAASAKITITINLQEMGISRIGTTKPDGTYKAGDIIPITLLFTQKVSFTDLVLGLNSGATISGLSSNSTALSHTINYTVGEGNNTENNGSLKVNSLSGTFNAEGSSAEGDNNVKDAIETSFKTLQNNFAENKIYIDTDAPTVKSYAVTAISDEKHTDSTGTYYLNGGKTVTLSVTFSEPVKNIGSSVLPLNSGESAVYVSGGGTDTLVYEYRIQSGNATELGINGSAYPTNIQDAAGNVLTAGLTGNSNLTYNKKSIVIDTKAPSAPTVSINGTELTKAVLSTSQVAMQISGENGATIEYSVDAGSTYSTYNSDVLLPSDNNKALNTYRIMARQTDLAGNVSPSSTLQTVTVDLRPIGIKGISTTKPSGVYKAGAIIPLTVDFYKAVTSEGKITLTLSNNATVSFEAKGASSYSVNYTVGSAADESTEALYATRISGTIKDTVSDLLVTTFEGLKGAAISNGKIDHEITASNLAKEGDNVIKIDTEAPTVNSYAVTAISDENHAYGSNYYLNAGKTVEIAVTFSEAVTISGDSVITLNNKKQAVYSGTSNDKTLYYTYTVASGGDTDELQIGAVPTNIQDIAGNTLTGGLTGNSNLTYGGKSIVIDTICDPPKLNGIDSGEIYNTEQTVELTGENGATFYYSHDGGGTKAKTVGKTFSTPKGEGRYQITAYQVDRAGNESSWANPVEIIVDTAPPSIKSISTTKGDGIYGVGEKLTITAEFSEAVTAKDLVVTLNTGATVDLSATNATAATGIYTVKSGDNTGKLAVTSVSGTITDAAQNSTTSFKDYANFAGKTIKIDTKAPTVTKYAVDGGTAKGIGTSFQNVSVTSKIALQFDEKVSKGSGTITVERVYKSYPAVMEVDEYNMYNNGTLSTYYIQRCIGTIGNEGNAPDTNAKYVLRYAIDHGAYESSNGLSGNQLNVYNYFKDLDYNVTKIDVNSSLVTVATNNTTNPYSTVTIQMPSSMKQGILYKVTFASGTFIDEAGNRCVAVGGTDVQFETGPTAVPVIRINKSSGRENGNQPYTTNVKISSEMYGATLHYGQNSTLNNNYTNESIAIPSNVSSFNTNNKDNQVELTLTANNNWLSGIFKIQAKTTKTNLTQGATSTELAYKTVIQSTGNRNSYVMGSDSSGGVSATTEFPMSWYEANRKSTAQLSDDLFVSWHILKDFQFKLYSNGEWITKEGNGANMNCSAGGFNQVN